MQPTFIPWSGFFDLIDQVDEFVFLNTVQFQKQTWQQRNRIVSVNGLQWLTVPVLKKGQFGQKISEVKIKISDFPRKQLKTIEQNYSRAPFFDLYWEELQMEFNIEKESALLEQLNTNLIMWVVKQLGMSVKFHFASQMDGADTRSSRLINIVTQLSGSLYISPIGSACYLRDEISYFHEAGLDVAFQNYSPITYRQQHNQSQPFASVLDLLFNEGPESIEIIRQGRSRLLKINEV